MFDEIADEIAVEDAWGEPIMGIVSKEKMERIHEENWDEVLLEGIRRIVQGYPKK